MLFMVREWHTLDQCPAREGEEALRSFYRNLQADVATKFGVKVHGLYTAPAQHTQFMLLESDSFDALNEYLRPLYLRGSIEMFPVTSFAERIDVLSEQIQPPPVDYYCMTCREDVPSAEVALHKGHRCFTQGEMEEVWPHEFGGEAGGG